MGVMKSYRQLMGMDEALTDDAIDILKSDHRKVERIFAEFESTQKRRQKEELLDAIVSELTIHARVEEELVYPALMENNEKRTREALEEHHVVKLAIAELADIDPDDEMVHAKVKVLSEMVNHHVKEEERVLLSKLKRAVYDLDELGARIRERKEQLLKNMKASGQRPRKKRVENTSEMPSTRSARNTVRGSKRRSVPVRRKAS